MTRPLAEIAQALNVPLPAGARADLPLTGPAMLADARETELSFLGDKRYLPELNASRAGAFVVQRRIQLPPDFARPVLLVDDADLAMARVATLFAPPVPRPPAGVDPAARVDPTATLGHAVAVGPNAVIGARASIGARTVIHPGVVVGDDTTIGDDCELFPNVVVRERCTLGHRVVIHANSAIGSDGFGYRWDGAKHAKIPQIGVVVIEDDVEIGSCTCVDRAKFGVTRVGRGTKIDNLVQVAHNVVLGPHCVLAGQSGVAGSAKLGTGVMLGGQSAVRDHGTMGDGSMLAACSGLLDSAEPKQVVSGVPAIPHRQTLREQAALRHLPELRTEVRKLQEELAELRKSLGR
jgi:UDP-3-O-[3-hydroxymyristoyl] glucosamine N-acyltransferase